MALNFPADPAAQTPANTFGPTSTPDATTNGATYIWNGVTWTGSTEGGDANYLSTDSGAGTQTVFSPDPTLFTGNVLVGGSVESPNITLNAGGSAVFAGNVEVNSGSVIRAFDNTSAFNRCEMSADASGSIINSTYSIGGSGNLKFQTVGIDKALINVNGDFLLGGTLPSAPNITLSENGTIESLRYIADQTSNDGYTFLSQVNGAVNSRIDSGGIKIGGTLNAGSTSSQAPNISLNSDGTAEAVEFKAYPPSDGDWGIRAFDTTGQRRFGVTGKGATLGVDSAGDNIWVLDPSYARFNNGVKIGNEIAKTSTNFPNIWLWDDGLGQFANGVEIGGTLEAPKSPNITLNADGSGSFSGNVISSADSANSSGIFSNGAIYAVRDGVGVASINGISNRGNYIFAGDDGTGSNSDQYKTYLFADGSATFAGNMGIGGTLPSAPNITLNADGSGTFAETVTIADGANNTSGIGGIVFTNDQTYFAGGNIAVYKSSDADSLGGIINSSWEAWARDAGAPSTEKMTLRSFIAADGDASFRGTVRIGGTILTPLAPGAPNITLNADGSATFAGNVQSGSINGADTLSAGTRVYSSGEILIQKPQGSTENVFSIYNGSSSNTTVTINATGSATFAGDVLIPDAGYRSSKGIKLFRTGIVQAVGDDDTNVFMGFDVNDGPSGIATSYILANGSAQFAGRFTTESGWTVKLDTSIDSGCNLIQDSSSNAYSYLQRNNGSIEIGGVINAVPASSKPNISLNSDGTNNTFGPGNITNSAAGVIINANADSTNGWINGYRGGLRIFQNDDGATINPKVELVASTGVGFFQGGVDVGGAYAPRSPNTQFLSNGNGTMAGTLTQNASDAKFKDNVANAPSQSADIKALQLRTWDWNSDAPGTESRKARHTMGLVAQEAALVDADIAYTANESAEDVDKQFQAIDHDVLTMKLLGALQEALAEIDSLKARLQHAGI